MRGVSFFFLKVTSGRTPGQGVGELRGVVSWLAEDRKWLFKLLYALQQSQRLANLVS